MRHAMLALVVAAAMATFPAHASPAAGDGGLTVLSATIRFDAERGGPGAARERTARIRMEGVLNPGPGLAVYAPGDAGLAASLGPAVLLDGAAPVRSRVRRKGSGDWKLTVHRAFGGRGTLSLRMIPASGTFSLRAWGGPAGDLLSAGPGGVAVSLSALEDACAQTLDFEAPRERRWEYRHRNVPRPPPPGGGGGGGGGGGTGLATLAQGTQSLITTFRFEVCRDAASWEALWSAHGGAGSAPAVDFSADMVVGVWLGTKPTGGVTVDIYQVVPATVIGAPCLPSGCPPGGAMAGIFETQWGPTCGVSMALSQPFHIVRAPRVEGPVLYEISTRVNDCP